MLHQCTQCDYNSNVKCNVQRHMKNKHGESLTSNYNRAQNNVFVRVDGGTHTKIQHEFDLKQQSTQHGLGTGGAQDNQTVSIQGYNNIIEETYKWKDAYEGKKQVNIIKDNDVKIRDTHLLNINNKLQTEFMRNKQLVLNNNEKENKVCVMAINMGNLIT